MKPLNTAICFLLFVIQLQTASAQTFVYDVDISEVSFFAGEQYRVFGSLEVNLDTDQIINSSLEFQIADNDPLDLTLILSQNPSGFIDFFDDGGDLFFTAGLLSQNGSRFFWEGDPTAVDQTDFSIFGGRIGSPNGESTPNGTIL